ncbi:MAG: chorismate mutase, partial [Methylococcus sp.]
LELREQVSDWLAEREADGWLPALRRTLGVESAAISAATVCGEALGTALEARLALMPRVVAIKRHLGLPITDPAQEARVLAKVRKQAAELNLAEEDVANLFRTLIRLAKAVQERSHEPFQPGMTLESVRALVAVSSTPLMQELGRCGPPLAGHEDELSQALQSHLADLLHPEELSELLNVLPPRRGFVSHARSVVSPDIPSVDAGVRH